MPDHKTLIRVAREAVQALPKEHPDRTKELSKLASHLYNRYLATQHLGDLEEAISTSRDALSATPKDDPARPQRSINVCVYVGSKFNSTETADDLEEAITASREVLLSIPPDYPNRAILLNKLAVQLTVRYTKANSRNDIEEAIQYQREALDTGPLNHSQRLTWLSNLGAFIVARYEITKAVADIDEAVQIFRTLFDMVPAESPMRHISVHSLGNTLGDRYLRLGNVEDLDEAISIKKAFISTLPASDPERCSMLNNYGILLGHRYLGSGATVDLEEAIKVGEEVLDLLPSDSPERASYLSNIAAQLNSRYERLGTIADLDRAIQFGRDAVGISPEVQRAKSLNNLGVLLKNRYMITGALGDLENAIRVQRQAISEVSEDHTDALVYLSNLSGLLRTRFQRTEATADLEEAHQTVRQVIDICPKDYPIRAMYLNTLGVLFGDLFARKGVMADLEEAVLIAQEAVEATGQDHPQRAARLINLGNYLGEKFTASGNINDLERAIAYHQSALSHSPSSTMARIEAGRAVIKWCAAISDWQKAYEAAEIAMQLVPKLTSSSMETRDKQDRYSQLFGLASDAAAVSFKAGKGALAALRFLEQGRGLLTMSLEEAQQGILNLKLRQPEVADQFIPLRDELDTPWTNAVTQCHPQADASATSQENDELGELKVNICETSGAEDFVSSPSETEFRNAAIHGPLIVINVSKYGCNAVLIEQHQIRPLSLPSLSIEHIKIKSQDDDLGSLKVLEWLWNDVADPILSALGMTGPPPAGVDLPHIWWIPTGVLSIMPLHVAGLHYPGSTETVLDRAMSSYSSSIRAIIQGRRSHSCLQSGPSIREKVLLVAMEFTPANSRLVYAKEEISMLRHLCKTMRFDPIEPGRRNQDIMSYLPQCKIFHFAGHGYTDPSNPSKSSLLLEDWQSDPLTLATLQETNIREHAPFLAYLSACGTGQVRHERFLDENLHLISGFQMAGFRHVIGTLWHVNDKLCVDMAKITYKEIERGNLADQSVCRGLHKATKELRDRWLIRQSSALESEKPFKNAHDETEIWSAAEANQDNTRLPRDIVSDDDEDDSSTDALLWVPYIHYGV